LSDYFQSVESPSELYEEQVAFIFAVAIYQELQNRGFPYLLPYIQFEKPYPIRGKRGKKPAVDIYFKIPKDKLPPEILHRWSESGVCEENWIEVKFFGGAERKGSSETKAQNVGVVLADLLRLKYYVREGGKYLLLVFNRKPEYYLAFTRLDSSRRDYLNTLLEPGEHRVMIDLAEEPKTVLNTISKHFGEPPHQKIELNTLTYAIKPLPVKGLILLANLLLKKSREGFASIEPAYYFYLIRIMEYLPELTTETH
jgi:hypothetical protein